MRKRLNKKITVAALLYLGLSFAAAARAAVTISTNIPGVPATGGTPCDFIFSFYKFAMMIAGVLAFGAIVYGGVKYTLAAGNPSGQSEGKEWVKGALYGLFLLVFAYLILNIINPNLTKCTLPVLTQLSANNTQIVNSSSSATAAGSSGCTTGSYPAIAFTCVPGQNCPGISCLGSCTNFTGANCTNANCTPTAGNLGVCSGTGCRISPSLATAVACFQTSRLPGTVTATTNGQHHCVVSPLSVSCHFGGTSCTDGGHAFDVAGKPSNITWDQLRIGLQGCADSCFCEDASSNRPGCSNAAINHIHCNVGSCGCN